MKVLVVDDEQLVRWFLERALRKWGHEVISVSSALEAMTQLEGGRFDILFTDLRMPEGNGTVLLNKVKQSTSRDMRVVVCSAFITADMIQNFERDGILTLKKPFKLAELEGTLNQCSNC